MVILSSSANSKFLGAYLSGITDSSYVSNVIELPKSLNPFILKRTCFTNKAFSQTEVNSDLKIISITSNSFGLIENLSDPVIESLNINCVDSNHKILNIEKETGSVQLQTLKLLFQQEED